VLASENPKRCAIAFSCDAEQLEYITGDKTLSTSVIKEIEAEEKNNLKEKNRLEKDKKINKNQKLSDPEQIPETKPDPDDQTGMKTQATLFSFGV